MGLAPELLDYAENIWRRFPEVFISLGSPDVEDLYELKQPGSWSHSIIDTLSEKVIEIVLPRRGRVAGDYEAAPAQGVHHTPHVDDDDEEDDEAALPSDKDVDDDDEDCNTLSAGLFSPTSSSQPHSPGTLVCDLDIDLQVEHISRELSHLASTLEECVSREVCAQLAHGFSGLFQSPDHLMNEKVGKVRQVAQQLVHGRPLAASALAARRGFRLFAVEAKGLRRLGCVMRMEEACREEAPPDQQQQQHHHHHHQPYQQNAHQPEGSPGAAIQAAARFAKRQLSGVSSPGEPFLPPHMMGLPQPFAGFSPYQSRNNSPERDMEEGSSDASPGSKIQRAAQMGLQGRGPPMLLSLGQPSRAPAPIHIESGWIEAGVTRWPEVAHLSFLTLSESPNGSAHHDGSPLSLTESSTSGLMPDTQPLGGYEEGSPRKRR